MSVNFEDYRLTYNGNGSTDLFPYKWPASEASAFSITKVLTDGSTEEITSNYTANGIGDSNSNNWTILYPTTGTKLQTGEKLIVAPKENLLQGIDFSQQGNNNPIVFGQALDKLTIIAQQLTEKSERSFVVPQGSDFTTNPEELLGELIAAKDEASASATAAGVSETNAAASAAAAAATLASKANKGANSDITSLSGLTTPLSIAQGGTGANVQPKFQAVRSTTQSISTGSDIKIQFNTENYDTNSNYDNATNYRFTPTVSGYYDCSLQVGVDTPESGASYYIILKINGSTKHQQRFVATGTVFQELGVSRKLYFNGSTDYIEAYIYNGGTVSKNITADSTINCFEATFIGK